jgi:hypothetical protein
MTLSENCIEHPSQGRAELIAALTRRVRAYETRGASHRAAIRQTATDWKLHPLRVKRLVDLYPET